MLRGRTSAFARFAPAAFFVFLATGCGGGKEEAQIKQFFRASQLRDSQTLANFAATNYDPRDNGIVQSFTITQVSEERRQPLVLKDLAKAHDDARAAESEFSKRKKTFQDENYEAIGRVVKAERANSKLKGKDAEVQTAWLKWRTESADYAKKVSEARTKLQSQRPIAEMSLEDHRKPVDVTKLDGEMLTKDVTVDAQVRLPADKGGQVVPKTLVLTMQRAVVKIDGTDTKDGRWIITSLKETGDGGPPKTS
jgi:hypothetical protein